MNNITILLTPETLLSSYLKDIMGLISSPESFRLTVTSCPGFFSIIAASFEMAAGVVFEETPSYYGLKNKIAIFSHEYSFEQIFKKKKKEAVPDGSLAFIKVALYWVDDKMIKTYLDLSHLKLNAF